MSERLFDYDPEIHPRREGEEKRLPGWMVADLMRADKQRLRQRMLNEPYNPPERCTIRGCDAIGTELHHWAERSVFGDFAERCPVSLVCKDHHDLITDMRRIHEDASR
jgi:hypothetical protein